MNQKGRNELIKLLNIPGRETVLKIKMYLSIALVPENFSLNTSTHN